MSLSVPRSTLPPIATYEQLYTHLDSRQYSALHAGVHDTWALVEKLGDVALVCAQLVPKEGRFRSEIARHTQRQE